VLPAVALLNISLASVLFCMRKIVTNHIITHALLGEINTHFDA
jgi:hypothetical protein